MQPSTPSLLEETCLSKLVDTKLDFGQISAVKSLHTAPLMIIFVPVFNFQLRIIGTEKTRIEYVSPESIEEVREAVNLHTTIQKQYTYCAVESRL